MLSQSQIVVKSARVLDVERCHVRVVPLSTSGRSDDTMVRAAGGLRAGRFRSGRIAIPCGGWARSFTGKFMPVAGGRDASAIPSVWIDVCPVVGRVFRMKYLTCLRGASGGSLLAYGLQLVWSEQVGSGSGSDPGGTVSHLAQISLSVVFWVGHIEHRTARSDAPCRGKTTEWFTCMGGAARC